MMHFENVNVGDKFATETKLIIAVGLEPLKGNSKKAQLNEIKRYIAYEKTHKLYRGKETNEIVITEKYLEPKAKIDNRKNNGKNDYFEWFEGIIPYIKSGKYTTTQLFEAIFAYKWDKAYIEPYKMDKKQKTSNKVHISTNLRQRFKANVLNALEKMDKNGDITFVHRYRLWDGKDFKNGYDTVIYSKDKTEITNDDIIEMEQDVKDKLMHDAGVKKMDYKLQQKAFEIEHKKMVKELFGYDNYCDIWDIDIYKEQYKPISRGDLEYYRHNLKYSLCSALVNYCNNYSYFIKDADGSVTDKKYHPFRNDKMSVDYLNQIADKPDFCEGKIDIEYIDTTRRGFGKRTKDEEKVFIPRKSEEKPREIEYDEFGEEIPF